MRPISTRQISSVATQPKHRTNKSRWRRKSGMMACGYSNILSTINLATSRSSNFFCRLLQGALYFNTQKLGAKPRRLNIVNNGLLKWHDDVRLLVQSTEHLPGARQFLFYSQVEQIIIMRDNHTRPSFLEVSLLCLDTILDCCLRLFSTTVVYDCFLRLLSTTVVYDCCLRQ
jgi:hypothetical protein